MFLFDEKHFSRWVCSYKNKTYVSIFVCTALALPIGSAKLTLLMTPHNQIHTTQFTHVFLLPGSLAYVISLPATSLLLIFLKAVFFQNIKIKYKKHLSNIMTFHGFKIELHLLSLTRNCTLGKMSLNFKRFLS